MLNASYKVARVLGQMYESKGSRFTENFVTEAMTKGDIKPNEISIRALAEELVPDGREWVRMLDPANMGGYMEAASFAVDTAAFSNITGQIAYTMILQAYNQVPNTISALIPTKSTRLSGEKIPGIAQLGDVAEIVDEGENYPTYGVSEDYIETPATVKRGFIVPVTREAIFFDRTNLLLDRCSAVGESMRTKKEKRAIDMLIDSATGIVNRVVNDHRYKWKGTSYETYKSSGGHGIVNLKTSNGLVDWTDINAVNLLFAGMTDPYTGEPISINAKTILVCPELEMTARSILTATAWQVGDTTGTAPVRIGPNLVNGYSLVSSPQLNARALADSQLGTTWYMGDPARAFAYMENWPITVVQAPPNGEDDFNRDIVAKYKVSERGAYTTVDPRYMVRSTVA